MHYFNFILPQNPSEVKYRPTTIQFTSCRAEVGTQVCVLLRPSPEPPVCTRFCTAVFVVILRTPVVSVSRIKDKIGPVYCRDCLLAGFILLYPSLSPLVSSLEGKGGSMQQHPEFSPQSWGNDKGWE